MKTDKKIYAEGMWRKCWINNDEYYMFKLHRKNVYLHRFLYEKYHKCSILSNVDVHHIDGDKLNNHPQNLELKFHKAHSCEHKIGNKHRFKGGSVCWHKGRQKWRAQVYVNKKQKCIGSFNTEQEARNACNKYYEVQK